MTKFYDQVHNINFLVINDDALENLGIELCNSLLTCVLDIPFSIYSVNFIVIFQTTANILQIYCWVF